MTLAELRGTLAGRYEIEHRLGAGGMGEVYRARDRKLKRTVAIKRLPPELATEERHRRQLLNEARSAARVNHQGLAALYDVVEERDQLFLVMEYVEGTTLRDRLRSPVDADDAVRIMVECAEAMSAAHAGGIVHRDIKPANIMLTPSAQVKILDFGLAHIAAAADPDGLTRSYLTETSHGIAGTPPYMAPEVLLGKRSDYHADLFSLGVVFYELVTGTNPFMAATATAIGDRILHLEPPPVVMVNPAAPPQIQSIVGKLLTKNPQQRYATTDDLLVDLRNLELQLTNPSMQPFAPPAQPATTGRPGPWLLGTVALLAVVVVGALGYDKVFNPSAVEPAGPAASAIGDTQQALFLAVLPPPEAIDDARTRVLNDGLVATLTTQLTQLTREHPFQVVSTSTLVSRGVASVDDARREIGVNRVLAFHLQTQGKLVLVNVSLIDATNGLQLDAASVDGSSDDLIGLQGQVSDRVLRMLRLQLNPMERGVMVVGTSSPEAYAYFISGEGYARSDGPGDIELAIEQFQQALRVDPEFAQAHAALGIAMTQKYRSPADAGWLDRALAECTQAIKQDELDAAGHACLGSVQSLSGDHREAIASFVRARDLDPTDGRVIRGLANAHRALGQDDEAEASYLEAIRLLPHSAYNYTSLGSFYYRRSRWTDAIDAFDQAIRLAPDSYGNYSNLGAAYFQSERWVDARRAFERSLQLNPDYVFATSNLGTLLFYEGEYAAAARQFERALELDDSREVTWGNLGDAYTWAPGESPRAKAAYERAIELAEQLIAVDDGDVTAHSHLGYYYAMSEDAAAALTHTERALTLLGDSSEILYKAAQTHQLLGRSARAFELIGQALGRGHSTAELEVDPIFADSSEVQQLLADRR